jgi:hypothetical protein
MHRVARFATLLLITPFAAVAAGSASASAAAISAAPDSLDGACVALRVFSGNSSLGYVARDGDGYKFSSTGTPIRLEATQLNRYELLDTQGQPLYQSIVGFILAGGSYGDRADYTVAKAGDRYKFTATATGQVMGSFLWRLGSGNSGNSVELTTSSGCFSQPDVATGVSGTAAPGVDGAGHIVGTIDAHAHITAGAAFGGQLHCGDAWASGGVEVALKGCSTHQSLNLGALFEAIVGGTDAVDSREDGWPTFGDWPKPNSLLHEQSYYRGIERSWRSGQRVLNALLVANRVICELFPYRDGSCDEMEQIRAQARYLYSMQDYIDAQSGGAGKGWFRIATTPAQVRSIAAQGKLAVTVGVENSELFGCRENAQCTTAQIDAGLDELQSFGVSGIYPVHKFDNAFGGTRFDSGTQGAAVNIGQLLSTGHWWQATSCTGPSDNEQPLTSDDFATLLPGLPPGTILPVYPSGKICNVRGLTPTGAYLIQKMMDRGMIIHIDHMSVKTASAVLDLAQAAQYPGLSSAHSWSDPALINRMVGLGGFVATIAEKSPDFVSEWRANRAMSNGASITGYGFGSDVNGFHLQPEPRAGAPLAYPFTAPNGTTVQRQVFGTRTFDLNTDGVAQYGLYADWTVDLIQQAGADGARLRQQLLNGAEAYTRMWEQARA